MSHHCSTLKFPRFQPRLPAYEQTPGERIEATEATVAVAVAVVVVVVVVVVGGGGGSAAAVRIAWLEYWVHVSSAVDGLLTSAAFLSLGVH